MKYSLKPQSFIIPLIVGGITWFLSDNFSIGATVFAVFLIPALITLYIPYSQDNPKHLWFKRKVYGWGWVPVTWQGWLTTGLYVVLIMAFGLTIDETSPANEVMFTFILPLVLISIAFIRLCYKKGEKPKWQWGIEDKKD